jgi:hypothetical protein
MKKLIALALTLLTSSCAPPAYAATINAGFVYTEPGLRVEAKDEPCIANETEEFASVALLAMLQGVNVQEMQHAVVGKEGEKDFNACWVVLPEGGRAFIIDERGGFGSVQLGTGI